MKVQVHKKSIINDNELKVIHDFLKFLNKKMTLTENIRMDLVDKKGSDMTTGVREGKHHLKILCKDRMLVDILRTIAHEWVHEYQHQKMGLALDDKVKEIGGWVENHANAVSGMLVKEFSKKHKDLEEKIYSNI
jgi:hypothetical protein